MSRSSCIKNQICCGCRNPTNHHARPKTCRPYVVQARVRVAFCGFMLALRGCYTWGDTQRPADNTSQTGPDNDKPDQINKTLSETGLKGSPTGDVTMGSGGHGSSGCGLISPAHRIVRAEYTVKCAEPTCTIPYRASRAFTFHFCKENTSQTSPLPLATLGLSIPIADRTIGWGLCP